MDKVGAPAMRPNVEDLYYFNQGTHFRLDQCLGAQFIEIDGHPAIRFTVWAPNAARVDVIGDFNGWNRGRLSLEPVANSGLWSGCTVDAHSGDRYKYAIWPNHEGSVLEKADPIAFFYEQPPRTASRIWDLEYTWHDQSWMNARAARRPYDQPVAVYEVHLGSWRPPEGGPDGVRYRQLADQLPAYVRDQGFTHVELMPVMEHPFYGSWGYQSLGYFAPSSRYGTPQEFMYLIDRLHQAGIGVILDWVPAHFPQDDYGLGNFDGTHLYEHADQRQGVHPDWGSYIYNYGRHEVQSFLLSSAMFWVERYHADGLRVDAVASMLYLDYSRGGQFVPNVHGGNANLDAIDFLKTLNRGIYQDHPELLMIAEESTSWPGVSRPVDQGGLGFGFKWDMGWMHDTLHYLSRDPIHRQHHQGELMFRMNYAYSENFMLPLSHDEVVHGKGSLFDRMPGDYWQKIANLRLLYGYQYTMSGKKLLFMGDEWGQPAEWDHDRGLDWAVLRHPWHQGLRRWVRELNRVYRMRPELYRHDCDPEGFEWTAGTDSEQSIFAFLRYKDHQSAPLLIVLNATPVPRLQHPVGVPQQGRWREILNSDDLRYGGAGWSHAREVETKPWDADRYGIEIGLPALSAVVWQQESS